MNDIGLSFQEPSDLHVLMFPFLWCLSLLLSPMVKHPPDCFVLFLFARSVC